MPASRSEIDHGKYLNPGILILPQDLNRDINDPEQDIKHDLEHDPEQDPEHDPKQDPNQTRLTEQEALEEEQE